RAVLVNIGSNILRQELYSPDETTASAPRLSHKRPPRGQKVPPTRPVPRTYSQCRRGAPCAAPTQGVGSQGTPDRGTGGGGGQGLEPPMLRCSAAAPCDRPSLVNGLELELNRRLRPTPG